MFNKIKKNKFNILAYLFCAFIMALFCIISFNCKTYAYTIDNNGNLVGDNLIYFTENSFNSTKNGVNLQFNKDTQTFFGSGSATTSNTDYTATINNITLQANKNYYMQVYGTFATIIFIHTNNGYVKYHTFDNGNTYLETFTFNVDTNQTIDFLMFRFNTNMPNKTMNFQISISDKELTQWEPYGTWYSKTNYDTIDNLYNNALSQYNDLALGNNYGYWKYIDYVEFYVNNSNIFVPNTQEQNEWSTNDLINNNILKIGGYFDTTSLTLEPYQSNYNEVDSYISFNAYTPSESFIMTFNHCDGCNVVINDENSNSFSYTISETNYLIDINLIRQNVPSFGLYVYEMYISPNNAEQNGIYFANNDYISAYNKGYNVATSNADRKYIPQITDLQNQINSLNNNVIELTNNINTLKSLNDDLQEQINSTYSWQNLFFAFADTPFKVVSNVLGFELFGLNLFSTFIGMITVFGVVYLLKKFF